MRTASLTTSLLVLAVLTGCPEKRAPAAGAPPAAAGAAAAATAEAPDDVTLPRVAADNANLLFSWLDGRGRMRTSAKREDIPPAARERVGVVDLSLTPEQRQAHRYAFFADLTAPDASGAFPVVVVSRYDAARGETLKVALPAVPEGTVIVYSAEWCGFCKKAKRWLAEKKVPFVERDVEKQPGASQELQDKLAAAKLRGGGVPVIDWDGTLIVGFDKRRLEKLLAERPAGGH
jgi:glutaredoxin